MNPMSLLTLPPEVLAEMRHGSRTRWPSRVPVPRGPGFVERELLAFGRGFWAAMLTPPIHGKMQPQR